MTEAGGAVISSGFLRSWLAQWPWTHVAHLVFNHANVTTEQAERELKSWRLALIKGESLQLASMGVLSHRPSSHLHVLLLGQNRFGKTLMDLTPNRWLRYTNLWHGDAKVDAVYSDGIYGYVEDQNTPDGHYELLWPFNQKLLIQVRGRSTPSISREQQERCLTA